MQDIFLKAVKEGNLEIVKNMLTANKKILDFRDTEGLDFIHWAALKGHKKIIEVLLQSGSNVKSKTNDGRTPMHLAASGCTEGAREVIKFLAELGIPVDVRDNNGLSPIHLALWNANWPILTVLIGLGANIDAQDNAGRTALHLAGQRGFYEARLLLALGADPNVIASNGNTYLHEMVATDGAYMLPVDELSETQADITIKNQSGETALDIAIKNNRKEAIEALKKWKSFKQNSNSFYFILTQLKQNKLKELSLKDVTYIVAEKNPSIPKLSLEHKVALLNGIRQNFSLKSLNLAEFTLIGYRMPGILLDILIDILNKHPQLKEVDLQQTKLINETLEKLTSIAKKRKIRCFVNDKLLANEYKASLNLYLFEAIEENDHVKVRNLIKMGADINAVVEHTSAIVYAAAFGKFESLQVLLELGESIDGYVGALSIAAQNGKVKAVELLLENGADIKKIDRDVLSNILIYQDNIEMLKLLLKAGIDCTTKLRDTEETPLDIAIRLDKKEYVRLIKEHIQQMQQEQIISTAPTPISALTSPSLNPDKTISKEKTSKDKTHRKKRTHKKTVDESGAIQISMAIPYSQLTIGKELGRGGFGIVYEGQYQFGPVAIKTLLHQELKESVIEEFKKEASIMASLRSPFIVTLYGICLEKPHYALVMECMSNGSLLKFLRNEKPIEWKIRYQIGLDVGCGLGYLHNREIVHCDLKSLNILLDMNHRAKLSDFGLSKMKLDTSFSTVRGGTYEWMAPELFQESAKGTKAADIYAFGIVLWELGARKKPFPDTKSEVVPFLILQGKREKITEDTPPSMAKLIAKCWDGRSESRPKIEEAVKTLQAEQASYKF